MIATKFQISFILLFFAKYGSTVKTCCNWKDYLNFFGENSCEENLDSDDEFSGIVERWGKQVETYEILTYDGYYLTLFRILPNKDNASPVLLLHGTFMNSLAMVDRGDKSLAYQFVHKGYDVWLINWRGTKYSKKHVGLEPTDPMFWKFSFNEWGIFDLPQALTEIKKSNNQKVLIVGFEQGNTAALAYSTLYPDEAQKNLKGIVSLSPTAVYMDVGVAVKVVYYSVPFVFRPLQYLNHGEVPGIFTSIRASIFCRYGGIWVARFCDAYFMAQTGMDIGQQDPETLPVIVSLNRESISVMQYEHVYQMMKHKRFQQYDHGSAQNIAKYGSENPPEYNLSKIKVPQLFYVGRNDKSGTVQDASVLYQRIPKEYQHEFYVIEYDKFGLADFVQAKDINQLLHMHLMKKVTEFAPPFSTK